MSARPRLALLALLMALLAASAGLARADAPTPGGTVPSVLGLSLGEPSGFTRLGAIPGRGGLYGSTIRAEVTATVAPVKLNLNDGEAPLRRWSEPVSRAPASIHLRRVASSARSLRNRQMFVLVTLTAGGP